MVSWFAINAAVLGQLGKPCPEALTALLPTNWFKAETVAQVRRLWWFGRLIGNTDMHDGNLSFVPGPPLPGRPTAPLALAPVYDMLPMAYAPVRRVELPPGPSSFSCRCLPMVRPGSTRQRPPARSGTSPPRTPASAQTSAASAVRTSSSYAPCSRQCACERCSRRWTARAFGTQPSRAQRRHISRPRIHSSAA